MTGDEFLADPGFASNQHRRIVVRKQLDRFAKLRCNVAGPNNLNQRPLFMRRRRRLRAQLDQVRLQRLMLAVKIVFHARRHIRLVRYGTGRKWRLVSCRPARAVVFLVIHSLPPKLSRTSAAMLEKVDAKTSAFRRRPIVSPIARRLSQSPGALPHHSTTY